MLNFNRSARPGEAKPADKTALKPAVSSAAYPLQQGNGVARQAAVPASVPPVQAPVQAPPVPELATPAPASPTPAPPAAATISPAPAAPAAPSAAVTRNERASSLVADTPGSKLIVGPNIKLKGVEISDCDVLVVEGHVEATIHSKAMQVAQPGTLKGLAMIDVAEIDGTFTGELTAHTKLVVNGTGRVSGTIRYGRLIVAEGGEISGDVKCIDSADSSGDAAPSRTKDARPILSPEEGRRS